MSILNFVQDLKPIEVIFRNPMKSKKLATTRFRGPMHPPLQKSSAIPALPWSSNTMFEIFTRVGPDNSLERLTERSVGLVTDRPSNVYELFVTLFE
jgi:hypothetical protein